MLQKTDYGGRITEFAICVFCHCENLQSASVCKFVAIQNLKFKGKIALKFAKLLTKVEIQGIVF